MNIKKFVAIGTAVVAVSALALDYVEVTGVTARQRYPWNGLVDIDFTLDSKATEPYLMSVVAYDNVGKTNLPVRSVFTENVSCSNNPCMVTKDASRIVWDASADLPNGFKCANVLVTCEDTRSVKKDKLYCVIDVSGGKTATSYPVSYLDSVPVGGWGDEYKTTKIVLRRVDAGSFMMGSLVSEVGRAANEDYHKVTISKPFYISVFEITESQYLCVKGGTASSKMPILVRYAYTRGDDLVNYVATSTQSGDYNTEVKTSYCWPDSENVDPNSFVGLLRSKTSIKNFDIPLESQWEYAARGGCITAVNNGTACTTGNVNVVGRNVNNRTDKKNNLTSTATTYVGSYMPNALGLYDMLGNAAEWCRDVYQESLGTADMRDPKGGAATVLKRNLSVTEAYILRVIKGGGVVMGQRISWTGGMKLYGTDDYGDPFLPYTACRSAARGTTYTSQFNSGEEADIVTCGFRIVFEAE